MLKQKFQLMVVPKLYHVLNFYCKGEYFLYVELYSIDQNAKTIWAYPQMHLPLNFQKKESQMPKVYFDQNQTYYETSHFNVTFSDELFTLKSFCIFKIQYAKLMKYKTYLNFKLMLKSKKKTNLSSQNNKSVQPPRLVDETKLCLNSYDEISAFYEVFFLENNYFSSMTFYIAAMPFGYRIRLNQPSLMEFACLSQEQKLNKQQQYIKKQSYITDKKKKEILKQQFSSLKLLEEQMIIKPLRSYKWYFELCSTYNIQSNISTQCTQNLVKEFLINLIQQDSDEIPKEKFIQKLISRYGVNQQNQLYSEILQQSVHINNNKYILWRKITNFMLKIDAKTFERLARPQIVDRNHHKHKTLTIKESIDEQKHSSYRHQFQAQRSKYLCQQKIYNQKDQYYPLLIVQNYEYQLPTEMQSSAISLTVMIHGYQGSDYDLQMACNFMNIYNPNTQGLLVKSIQESRDQNIEEMGRKVAEEVQRHIQSNILVFHRINFLGYSLGGIVARKALKYLEKYKQRMNVFITFASPHLGTNRNNNILVRTGIWFLGKFTNANILKELNCQQDKDDNELFMNKLAQCPCLEWFRKVVVVSSHDDNFVPYESSRIHVKSEETSFTTQMHQGIRSKIKKLERVDVWFDFNHDVTTIDKVLGRRAHIQFLQNTNFLDSFFRLYSIHL